VIRLTAHPRKTNQQMLKLLKLLDLKEDTRKERLNNLKVIHDLYSQCLTQILSKTTFFSSMEGVYLIVDTILFFLFFYSLSLLYLLFFLWIYHQQGSKVDLTKFYVNIIDCIFCTKMSVPFSPNPLLAWTNANKENKMGSQLNSCIS